MKIAVILAFLCAWTLVGSSLTWAAKPSKTQSKIIDLGDLEVQGELRRPNLFMIESSQRLDSIVEKAASKKWELLEKELLNLDDPRSAQP